VIDVGAPLHGSLAFLQLTVSRGEQQSPLAGHVPDLLCNQPGWGGDQKPCSTDLNLAE
jgi:hypothetical protein